MAYVIGIDTGGTYTDAVLLHTDETGFNSVKRKSKAITTHHDLVLGIKDSIEKLSITRAEKEQTEKVVLSTTLATNAIVEGKIYRVGLIVIGDRPNGNIATDYVKTVRGQINIKGRILIDIDKEEVKKAVKELAPKVDSVAVSGFASVRNPVLEQKVKEIIHDLFDIPVMCGHECVSDLGFLERTNTVVINAGLLPIINNFIKAIKTVLASLDIKAPIFIIRGDGSIAKIDAIQNKPIDTVLSGPAASMIGAINLTKMNNAIIADMGGTTTDTGVVQNKRVELSADGAEIGKWKIRIKSAKLFTFGLGGDSIIDIQNGVVKVGPKRALPACRGGKDFVTPTDILHYTGEFIKWSKKDAVFAIQKHAADAGMPPKDYVKHVIETISKKINENMSIYRDLDLPIIAVGAPVESWYRMAQKKYGFSLVIPEHFEVANAVGAATAGIEEVVEAIVRPGEDGYGYLVHTKTGRYMFMRKEEAIEKAIEVAEKYATKMITKQGLDLGSISISVQDIYSYGNKLIHNWLQIRRDGRMSYKRKNLPGIYLGTNIKVTVSGKIFVNYK